ncbi:DsrE family protein [Halomonas sp. NYA30]
MTLTLMWHGALPTKIQINGPLLDNQQGQDIDQTQRGGRMTTTHKTSNTILALAVATAAIGFSSFSMADNRAEDQALVILTSDSLQTQGMAMILSNAMQQQGTHLHILLCDAAGDLAVGGYASAEAINTPPSNPAGQVKPEGMLNMLLENGATVDVCAIYLPNSKNEEDDLLEGVGVAAPGPIAEMMRDPSIPVYSF